MKEGRFLNKRSKNEGKKEARFKGSEKSSTVLKEIISRTFKTLVNSMFAGVFLYPTLAIWCLFGVCSVKICSIRLAVLIRELSKTAV